MINKKTNIILLKLFLGWALIITLGCNSNELLIFEISPVDTQSLLNCKDIDCASIQINLPKIIDQDDLINKEINTLIKNTASNILNIGEFKTPITLEKAVSDFNKEYQFVKKQFPDETPKYEVTINGLVNFQNIDLICIELESYAFTGGAHGYSSVTYSNINAKTGSKILNKDLFKNPKEFERFIEEKFRAKQNIPKNTSINNTGYLFEDETFSLPENIGFTNQEMILYYNSYEIASYAEGPIILKIAKSAIQKYLKINCL